MSQIRCIYSEEPKFPATDQHPSAARYRVGLHFVDAIGGQPTQAEVDAVLSPPPAPEPITAEELHAAMLKAGDGKVPSREEVIAERAAKARGDAAQMP